MHINAETWTKVACVFKLQVTDGKLYIVTKRTEGAENSQLCRANEGDEDFNTFGFMRFSFNATVGADIYADCFACVETEDNVYLTEEETKIVSADVTLGQDITVNYYVSYPEKHSTYTAAKMRFTVNGKTVLAEGTEVDGEYIYSFGGIAPQMMGDNIKAELVFEDVFLAVKEEYSVETYCKNMLTKTESSAALKTLLSDMLAYGAAAQNYRNYRTDRLVDAENAGTPSEYETIAESDAVYTAGEAENCKILSVNVWFDCVNKLRFVFTASDLEQLTVKIGEKTYTDEEIVSLGEGKYAVYTDAIYATEFEKAYTLELSEGGVSGGSLTFGVKAYVAFWQDRSENESMANLARTLYNYGKSAVAYRNGQN